MSFLFTPGCCCNVCLKCEKLSDEDKVSTPVYTSREEFEVVVKSQTGQDCQYGYATAYGEEYYVPSAWGYAFLQEESLETLCGNANLATIHIGTTGLGSAYTRTDLKLSVSQSLIACYGEPFTAGVDCLHSRTYFENGDTKTEIDEDGNEAVYERPSHIYIQNDEFRSEYNPNQYGYNRVFVDLTEPQYNPNSYGTLGILRERLINTEYKWTFCKNLVFYAQSETASKYDWALDFGWPQSLPEKTTSILRYGPASNGLHCIAQITARIRQWSNRAEREFDKIWFCPIPTTPDAQGNTGSAYYRRGISGQEVSGTKDTITPEARLRILRSGSYIDESLPEGHQVVTVLGISAILWIRTGEVESENVFRMNIVIPPERLYHFIPEALRESTRYVDTFYKVTASVPRSSSAATFVIPYNQDEDTATIRVIEWFVTYQQVDGDLSGMSIEELTQPPEMPGLPESFSPRNVEISDVRFYYLYEAQVDD